MLDRKALERSLAVRPGQTIASRVPSSVRVDSLDYLLVKPGDRLGVFVHYIYLYFYKV